MKILIIDDKQSKLRSIKEAIRDMTISKNTLIDTAVCINDAQELCRKKLYDLVVLDILIPRYKGGTNSKNYSVDFLKFVKSHTNGVNEPLNIIGLTSYEKSKKQISNEFDKYGLTVINYECTSNSWKEPLENLVKRADKKLNKELTSSFDNFSRVLIFISLILAISSIFIPINYTITNKVILFFVCSFIPALLWGKSSTTEANFNVGIFKIKTVGATAVLIAVLIALNHLTTPKHSIGIYSILDENGKKINLDSVVINCDMSNFGLKGTILTDRENIAIIFPKGIESLNVTLKKNDFVEYYGAVNFTPDKKQVLELGSDLRVK